MVTSFFPVSFVLQNRTEQNFIDLNYTVSRQHTYKNNISDR